MKKLPNHLAFHLTKEDFETTEYTNPVGCALASAIIREGYELGGEGALGVGGTSALIEGEKFIILEPKEIYRAYASCPEEGLVVNLLKIDD